MTSPAGSLRRRLEKRPLACGSGRSPETGELIGAEEFTVSILAGVCDHARWKAAELELARRS